MDPETGRRAELETRRLRLTAIQEADAAEMAVVLGDARLHEFIGGSPLGEPELRAQYRRWVAGSSRPDELWLNWVVRRREIAGPDETGDQVAPGETGGNVALGEAVGTVQATVTAGAGGRLAAEVAWVIGRPWQGSGFAAEAAAALVTWLAGAGVSEVTACIHPRHRASERVAERVGFLPTARTVDGERVWRLEPAGGATS
jgi:RimJ/RimL family protein N-acetyltransferase